MKNFFQTFFASALATFFVWCVAGVLAMFMFFVICVSFSGDSKPAIPKKAFLVLDLEMNISDAPEHFDGGLASLLEGGGPRVGLWDLMQALKAAETDRRIVGVFIRGSLMPENYGSGYATLSEVRRAIDDFKKSGKPVIAYLDQASLKDYYVASAADTIYLNPFATLPVHGLATESFYLGAAFKKYGIGVQTTKVGKYKSAVEPFISDKMSDFDRIQRQALLSGIWDCLVKDIAGSRKIKVEAIKQISEEEPFLEAEPAMKAGFVDNVAYLDEVIELLKTKGRADEITDSFVQIGIHDYGLAIVDKNNSGAPVVAVVYAEGEIVDGPGKADNIGGDSLAMQLRAVRKDPEVSAVVLRVNSPGGSAFASEVIQREVRLFHDAGKPIVISMGSYAASGGYWISAYGDKIFAEKTTITGSIGVFGLMFNIGELSKNIGVNFDGVKTSNFADIETISRPKNPAELALLQKQVDQIYSAFLDKVAEGRKLDRRIVEEIAEGRVWSGKDAKGIRLVDTFGGLREAVAEAANLAGVASDYTVVQHPERQTALEAIAQQLEHGGSGDSPIIKVRGHGPAAKLSGKVNEMWRTLENMNDRRGVYVRLPYSCDTE